ncbi:hypothetical protein CTA1_2600 [Colletotrichum tanaceti]|uniref:Uncharacterized protein n=1 Tax=Colletotrichum tanaceti TaxID=1306861 RepID=A0A4U6X141_9PEZI|nr:hypothetical protein CTA1_2600 [Colletotrichum tanaceti]
MPLTKLMTRFLLLSTLSFWHVFAAPNPLESDLLPHNAKRALTSWTRVLPENTDHDVANIKKTNYRRVLDYLHPPPIEGGFHNPAKEGGNSKRLLFVCLGDDHPTCKSSRTPVVEINAAKHSADNNILQFCPAFFRLEVLHKDFIKIWNTGPMNHKPSRGYLLLQAVQRMPAIVGSERVQKPPK